MQANFSSSLRKLQLGIFLEDTRSPPSHLPCRCSAAHLYDNESDTLWAFSFSAPFCISHVSEDIEYEKKKRRRRFDNSLLLHIQWKTQPWENELDCWHWKNVFTYLIVTYFHSALHENSFLAVMWKARSCLSTRIHTVKNNSLQEFDYFRTVIMPKLSDQSLFSTSLSQRCWFQTYFSQTT